MNFQAYIPIYSKRKNFDQIVYGAQALGRRVKQISGLSAELGNNLNQIFDKILQDEETALFIRQLAKTMRRDYAFCKRVTQSFIGEFENNDKHFLG